MRIATLVSLLVLPALLGLVAWNYAYLLVPSLILSLVGSLPHAFALLLVVFMPFVSYYAVGNASRWRVANLVLSIALTLWILVSFYLGAYFGELWAVHRAKSYLDGAILAAHDYLKENGEYPASLDKLDLPPMPHLVRESANRKRNRAYFFIDPYQRIDSRSIEVGFGYSKYPDECAMYRWTTKNPRWACSCAGCLTDNPNG